jgi:hypothetical protein
VIDRARSAELAKAVEAAPDASAFDYSREIAGVLAVTAAGDPGEEHCLEVRLRERDLDLRLRARLEQFAEATGVGKGDALIRTTCTLTGSRRSPSGTPPRPA